MKKLQEKIAELELRLASDGIDHNRVLHKTPSGSPIYNHSGHPKHNLADENLHAAGYHAHAMHAAAAHLSDNEGLREHHLAHASAHIAGFGGKPKRSHEIISDGMNALKQHQAQQAGPK